VTESVSHLQVLGLLLEYCGENRSLLVTLPYTVFLALLVGRLFSSRSSLVSSEIWCRAVLQAVLRADLIITLICVLQATRMVVLGRFLNTTDESFQANLCSCLVMMFCVAGIGWTWLSVGDRRAREVLSSLRWWHNCGAVCSVLGPSCACTALLLLGGALTGAVLSSPPQSSIEQRGLDFKNLF